MNWRKQTKRLSRPEKIACVGGYIGLLLFAIGISCYFASKVSAASKTPLLSSSVVKLDALPDMHLIVIEARICNYGENFAGCSTDGPHIPPHVGKSHTQMPPWPQHDFALGRVLTAAEHAYGAGFATKRQFIRPAPERVRYSDTSSAIVAKGGGSTVWWDNVLQTRVASFPFPISFQKQGSFPRVDYAHCMGYDFTFSLNSLSSTNFSGIFGKCNQSWDMKMFALNAFFNWSTCSVVVPKQFRPLPGSRQVPTIKNCTGSDWKDRFQQNSSWPADFFLLPVASAGSGDLFEEVQQLLKTWGKRSNATMAQAGPHDSTAIDPRTLTWELNTAFPQGMMMTKDNPKGNMRKVTFQASTCQGLRCTADDQYKISATVGQVASLAGAESVQDLSKCPPQEPLTQDFACATANHTVFGSVFREEVITGSLTFDWPMALGQIQSYVHVGYGVLCMIFPTVVYAGFYYRWGKNSPVWPDEDSAMTHLIDINDHGREEGRPEIGEAAGHLSTRPASQ